MTYILLFAPLSIRYHILDYEQPVAFPMGMGIVERGDRDPRSENAQVKWCLRNPVTHDALLVNIGAYSGGGGLEARRRKKIDTSSEG